MIGIFEKNSRKFSQHSIMNVQLKIGEKYFLALEKYPFFQVFD